MSYEITIFVSSVARWTYMPPEESKANKSIFRITTSNNIFFTTYAYSNLYMVGSKYHKEIPVRVHPVKYIYHRSSYRPKEIISFHVKPLQRAVSTDDSKRRFERSQFTNHHRVSTVRSLQENIFLHF